MTEKEKMIQGKPYNPADNELIELRIKARKLTKEFNSLEPEDIKSKENIIKNLFGKTGENIYIEPSFKCDYGFNICVGNNFYANFDCVILDVNKVTIGENCMLGPNVQIYTACHPITAKERISGIEYSMPVTIGNNCWICGSAIINPGITIGNNVVVASGSVVTKNVPDNVLVAGNPAKVIKIIEES